MFHPAQRSMMACRALLLVLGFFACGSAFPSSSTTYYMYDEAGHIIGEYDQDGNAIQEYIWKDDMLVGISRSGSLYYVINGQLGTPRIITDQNQRVVWKWDPDPFGNGNPNENPSGLGTFTFNLRLPGQYYDAETGHNYNYFRDYDPATGRYIESDPIGLYGGLNTYTYAADEPTGKIDPSGEAWGTGGTYDPAEGDNTVYCDEELALIALNNFNDYGCSALDDCAREHEGSHLKDAGGPSICKGNHGQKYVVNPVDAERLDSERRAFLVELDCLRRKLRQMDCQDRCKKVVQLRIDDIQNNLLPSVANGTYGRKN